MFGKGLIKGFVIYYATEVINQSEFYIAVWLSKFKFNLNFIICWVRICTDAIVQWQLINSVRSFNDHTYQRHNVMSKENPCVINIKLCYFVVNISNVSIW